MNRLGLEELLKRVKEAQGLQCLIGEIDYDLALLADGLVPVTIAIGKIRLDRHGDIPNTVRAAIQDWLRDRHTILVRQYEEL